MQIDVPLLVTACAILLGIGALFLAGFSLLPTTAAKARPAWPIFLPAVLIVGSVCLVFLIGGLVLYLALFLLTFRVIYEASIVALNRQLPTATNLEAMAYGVGAALVAMGTTLLPMQVVVLSCLVVLVAAILLLLFLPTGPWRLRAELTAFPLVPLIVYVSAASRPEYAVLMLTGFLLVETFDSYALLGGKLFGRHLAFPQLSPRKTIEGLLIGGLMLALTATLAAWLLQIERLGLVLILAVLAGGLAIVGDLLASRLKRKSGVKDYPLFLVHQGGLLDISDAWITAGAGLAALAALVPFG